MQILLHVCCAPCAVYPLEQLGLQGHEVTGFFYNPNIHPYQEFRRRIEAVKQFGEATGHLFEIEERYGLTEFLQRVVFHEQERCHRCYDMRLQKTVQTAAARKIEAFSTTLLYSKYQNHQQIIARCRQLAEEYGVRFHYEDFRMGWQQGIDASLSMGLYRQPYCGCIYSEQERYDKQFRRPRKQPEHTGVT
ncbi:MAG: epoxyqueuosine reductase QueH [Desulfobulbaceae bacterium]|nr:epoxyqueuosine reductase QueH [Desulfobulbaceae bacterium]